MSSKHCTENRKPVYALRYKKYCNVFTSINGTCAEKKKKEGTLKVYV